MVSFDKDSYGTKMTDKRKEISVLAGKASKDNDGKPKAEVWKTHQIAKGTLELAYDMTEPLRDDYNAKIESMFESEEFTIDHYHHALQEVESAFIPVSKLNKKIPLYLQVLV